jgi:hypothetical protein
MPISLEIVTLNGTSIYRDAAYTKGNPTIAEFKEQLTNEPYDRWADGTPYYYVPRWYTIESIEIINIATSKPVSYEETDTVAQFQADKYIIHVTVKRKSRTERKTQRRSGGYRSQSRRRRRN